MVMIRSIVTLILVLVASTNIFAQQERKLVREGVKDYQGDKYSDAEVRFRKALDARPGLYEAEYDIANSLYKQKKYEEAAKEYDNLIQQNSDPKQRADLFHNLGNSHLMAQQYEKGIEAYKNSLRLRPNDEDTRYNLAYALEKLKQQQQQQQKDQNKDKQDQKKKDDQKNQDKQKNEDKQNQDKQDEQKENKQDQQQQQNKPQDKKDDQKEKQQTDPAQNLSKQDAEQMLNAIQNQEKDVKEKVDKKKAVARPVSTEKDW
jgi:Ca-activated chloride channel family protein